MTLEYRLMVIETMLERIFETMKVEKIVCPICENKIDYYLPYGVELRKMAVCPKCGTVERHRTLWKYLEHSNFLKGKILHFAPERGILDKILKMDVDYYPVDINPNMYGIREVVDITKIPYDSDSFDIIICNHVLEHISDEHLALAELYRVLKKTGFGIINVPIDRKLDVTLENSNYNTDELRLKYYGQTDHVRRYGKDFEQHLSKAGFFVEKIRISDIFSREEIAYNRMSLEDIYVCKKITDC